jgi:hypothetical protein
MANGRESGASENAADMARSAYAAMLARFLRVPIAQLAGASESMT